MTYDLCTSLRILARMTACRSLSASALADRLISHRRRTHVLKHQVDVLIIIGLHHLEEVDDVIVLAQLLKEDDLTVCALRIGGVLESVEDLLQGNGLLSLLIHRLPHNAIGLPREQKLRCAARTPLPSFLIISYFLVTCLSMADTSSLIAIATQLRAQS